MSGFLTLSNVIWRKNGLIFCIDQVPNKVINSVVFSLDPFVKYMYILYD